MPLCWEWSQQASILAALRSCGRKFSSTSGLPRAYIPTRLSATAYPPSLCSRSVSTSGVTASASTFASTPPYVHCIKRQGGKIPSSRADSTKVMSEATIPWRQHTSGREGASTSDPAALFLNNSTSFGWASRIPSRYPDSRSKSLLSAGSSISASMMGSSQFNGVSAKSAIACPKGPIMRCGCRPSLGSSWRLRRGRRPLRVSGSRTRSAANFRTASTWRRYNCSWFSSSSQR